MYIDDMSKNNDFLSSVIAEPEQPVGRRNPNHQERLQKVIADIGYCSRRAAEKLIVSGRVKVNGRIISVLGVKIDPVLDSIWIDDEPLAADKVKRHILLYKPYGYICSVKDERGRRTVLDLIQGFTERIYPVGRLDYNTSGVLLLTNDGELTNKLLHPSNQIKKTYLLEVEGHVTQDEIKSLIGGIHLDGVRTAKAKARLVSIREDSTVLEIEIHEGKNRQVRRMTEAIGHKCVWLKRTSFAGLTLKDLKPRQWRFLTDSEILMISKNARR